jgi:hypothetical protein
MSDRASPIETGGYSDNPQFYCREFRAAVDPEETTPTAEMPTTGVVTETELVALAAIDVAERVAEPVTMCCARACGSSHTVAGETAAQVRSASRSLFS